MREIYVEITDKIRVHLVFGEPDVVSDKPASFTIERDMEDGRFDDVVAYEVYNHNLLWGMMENEETSWTNYEKDPRTSNSYADIGMWEWDNVRGVADVEDAVDSLFAFIGKIRNFTAKKLYSQA